MQHAICAIIAVSVLAVRAVFAMAVAVLQRSSWSSLGGPPPGTCSMFVCGRLPPECKVEATIQHVVGLPLAMLHDALHTGRRQQVVEQLALFILPRLSSMR